MTAKSSFWVHKIIGPSMGSNHPNGSLLKLRRRPSSSAKIRSSGSDVWFFLNHFEPVGPSGLLNLSAQSFWDHQVIMEMKRRISSLQPQNDLFGQTLIYSLKRKLKCPFLFFALSLGHFDRENNHSLLRTPVRDVFFSDIRRRCLKAR